MIHRAVQKSSKSYQVVDPPIPLPRHLVVLYHMPWILVSDKTYIAHHRSATVAILCSLSENSYTAQGKADCLSPCYLDR